MGTETRDRSKRLLIGDWVVDPVTGRISRGAEVQRLEPKVMAVLVHLAEHRGTVRPKEAIIEAVWADAYVGEAALSRCISELRRTLGDDARDPRYIETLPKRGYRLVAEAIPVAKEQVGADAKTVMGQPSRGRFVAAALILVLLFGAWWVRRPEADSSDASVESIAVLPLRALSDSPEQRFFAEGLTGQLTVELSGLETLTVLDASSRDVGGELLARQAGAELQVDAVLLGSVQQSGERILVNLELLHTADDRLLWAGSYQEIGEELLDIEQEVAAQAAREIALALAPGPKAGSGRFASVPEAQRAYDRGRLLLARGNPADGLRGLEYLAEALDLDPEFALAHAAIADAQATLAWHNWTNPEIAYGEARAAAYAALDLDPRLPEGHTMLAAVAAEMNWDWLEAERRFQTAIELDPASAFARERFARYLRRLGRTDEAFRQTSAALTSSPDELPLLASHAWNLLLAGRLDEAETIYLRVTELDDDMAGAYVGLCALHNLRGARQAAVRACERAAAMPGHDLMLGALAYAYARAGATEPALSMIARLQAINGPDEMAALAIATGHLGMGDEGAALEALERAVEQRVIYAAAVLEDPYLRRLNGLPRFSALLERMAIPTPSGG